MLKGLDTWHKSRTSHIVMAIIELLLAYTVGLRAFDTGSWWEYLAVFILGVGSLRNLIKLIGTVVHGKHKAAKA
jgi:hypothetical protein